MIRVAYVKADYDRLGSQLTSSKLSGYGGKLYGASPSVARVEGAVKRDERSDEAARAGKGGEGGKQRGFRWEPERSFENIDTFEQHFFLLPRDHRTVHGPG